MSRIDSNSSETFPLPRRSVLKALTPASAVVAATGQAFSPPKANAGDDPRLSEFASLAEEFYAALIEEINLPARISEQDRTPFDQRTRDAEDAIDAFVGRLDPKSPCDLGIRAKVAEWRYARRDDALCQDPWIHDLIRTNLTVAAIAPLEQNPFRAGYDDPRILTHPRDSNSAPRPDYKPDSVTAGEDIAEMRRLNARYLEALTKESNLDDDDPRRVRARVKTERRLQELFDFGELIKSKIGRCYSQRDDFIVFGNLVLAIDEIYLEQLRDEVEFFGAQATIDGHRNGVLTSMVERAQADGDRLVREAKDWHAANGGANA